MRIKKPKFRDIISTRVTSTSWILELKPGNHNPGYMPYSQCIISKLWCKRENSHALAWDYFLRLIAYLMYSLQSSFA